MMGPGAWSKSIGLSGMTWKSIKTHYCLIPTYIIAFGGMLLAGGYTLRLATKHPEVTWDRKGNPEPWNEYENKQYKFVRSGRDYSVGSPAPRFK